MATIHAQYWLAGINAPSVLEGCVCGWRVERSSILASEKQFEQHMADVLQGASGSPAPEITTVNELFDNSETLDDEVTILGADAERAALADAAQAAVSSPRPLTPREAAAVDSAAMMARASEHAIEMAQGTAATILTGGDRYKRALLCQLLEVQFIAGASFGAQRAAAFIAEVAGASRASTSEGDKP